MPAPKDPTRLAAECLKAILYLWDGSGNDPMSLEGLEKHFGKGSEAYNKWGHIFRHMSLDARIDLFDLAKQAAAEGRSFPARTTIHGFIHEKRTPHARAAVNENYLAGEHALEKIRETTGINEEAQAEFLEKSSDISGIKEGKIQFMVDGHEKVFVVES